MMSGPENEKRPVVGTSECLLGAAIRHNGGHLRDDWLSDELSKFVDFSPVCPELKMGLGVPRPAMRLNLYGSGDIRLESSPKKDVATTDFTQLARESNHALLHELEASVNKGMAGFIFAKKSPSCGVERVKIYNSKSGVPDRHGVGLFAQAFVAKFPHIPVIDSGRLLNPQLRENFMRQVMCYHRFFYQVDSIASLQIFHQRHKYILMEYHQKYVRELGQLAAEGKRSKLSLKEIIDQYKKSFFGLVKGQVPTIKARKNVIYHLLGYFKNDLGPQEKGHFLELVDEYEKGNVPYVTIVKMLDFFTHKYNQEYLKKQYYLNPYPKDLGIHKDAV